MNMTINDLIKDQHFDVQNAGSDPDREMTNVFCCDLLSIAMGKAPAGCAWVTVMSNINTLAVASLADAACIVLAEGIQPDDIMLNKAIEQDIPLFTTSLPVFEAALRIYENIRV